MRKLNLLVLGFTPMFTAVAFAQALNTGIKERMIVQAQAGQMGGQGMDRDRTGPGSVDRAPEDKTGDTMSTDKDKDKNMRKHGYGTPSGNASKQDPSKDPSSQARKGGRDESRPTGD